MSSLYQLGFASLCLVGALVYILICGRGLYKRRARRTAERAAILENLERIARPRIGQEFITHREPAQ